MYVVFLMIGRICDFACVREIAVAYRLNSLSTVRCAVTARGCEGVVSVLYEVGACASFRGRDGVALGIDGFE